MTKIYYKGFNKDLKCLDFQYEVGKEYKIDGGLSICNKGFHFCDSLQNVHNYYSCNPAESNRFCEIEVLGDLVSEGDKYATDYIKIKREIVGEELKTLLGLINGNTGIFNSGYYNSGNRNSGNFNSGYYNSGNRNSGNRNSGYYNSGYYNSGNFNSGNRNSGNFNSGDYNSGYYNSGYYNSGDYNSGDYNSGYYNSGNRNSGLFNTDSPNVRLFNKDTDMTFNEFYNSKYWEALNSAPFVLTEWYEFNEEEMKESIIRRMIKGKLITHTYKEACSNWWNKMTEKNKEIIKDMPNFDADIFFEITGIDVRSGEK